MALLWVVGTANVIIWLAVAVLRWGGGRQRRLESLFVYVLRRHPNSTGYELAKFAEDLGHGPLLSGDVYPTLQRLIARGWVGQSKGNAHPVSGKPRILYRLTVEGFFRGW